VAARSSGLRRRSAAARLLIADIVRSNPTGDMDVCFSVLYCQLEVSATSRSLVQRSPTDCGASCVIKKPRE
jgi:hypothetical protein